MKTNEKVFFVILALGIVEALWANYLPQYHPLAFFEYSNWLNYLLALALIGTRYWKGVIVYFVAYTQFCLIAGFPLI